jgi:luciferase-type oxidoreductase
MDTDVFLQHAGFRRMFAPGKLTLGFILPLEAYPDSPAPTMVNHATLGRLADELGFAGLWARDVPLYDPMFGDTGQLCETFTYLGFLAANTKRIALAAGSAVITLRHPLHLAKQAASVDQLSDGRMVLGISSGDRPVEYPAFGIEADFEARGERFREAYEMFVAASEETFPVHRSQRFGVLDGTLDLVPNPVHGRIPAIVTGRSRQDIEWIAKHADGWLYYFISPEKLKPLLDTWRESCEQQSPNGAFKPFAQGMFFDLTDSPSHPIEKIHAGIRVGRNSFKSYLEYLQAIGVNHVTMNLKASRRPTNEVLQELAEYVLPAFPSNKV